MLEDRRGNISISRLYTKVHTTLTVASNRMNHATTIGNGRFNCVAFQFSLPDEVKIGEEEDDEY